MTKSGKRCTAGRRQWTAVLREQTLVIIAPKIMDAVNSLVRHRANNTPHSVLCGNYDSVHVKNVIC